MPKVLKFENATYTPLMLRLFLRAKLQGDERVIGWASLKRSGTVLGAVSGAMLSIVPIIGPLLAVIPNKRASCVAVLTDQRLMLLTADVIGPSPYGDGLLLDEPLHNLELTVIDEGKIAIGSPRWPAARVFEVQQQEAAGVKRLIEAFGILTA